MAPGGVDDDSAPLLPMPANSNSRTESEHANWQKWIISILLVGAVFVIGLVGVRALGGGSKHRSDETSPTWPTFIGYAGPTPTGLEALAAATAYPQNHDTYPIFPPPSIPKSSPSFKLLESLGNLSPWHSVDHGVDASSQIPSDCTVEQVHLLHRHGARYPTTGSGPARFAAKLAEAQAHGFRGKGELSFMTDWTYKLGAEILTPFGRAQLFNLGVGYRIKYGGLLVDPTSKDYRKPVFRTESQDRMRHSALNFAAGFFGIPFEEQYHQLITVEAPGFNNTLAPYYTCPNSNKPSLMLTRNKVREWQSIYLKDALARFRKLVDGIDLTIRDIYDIQEIAAYEMVSLGGSAFSGLFTQLEWESFEYVLDLEFYYSSSYGQPAQAAIGLGWTQEFLSRVTGEKIDVFNSTTNSTLHTDVYFPLTGQNIYVDATHDTIISAVITTLGFASFSAGPGGLPSTHMPKDRAFTISKIAPFASNLHAQILSCKSASARPTRVVRWILNDGVVPLDSIKGCDKSPAGMCDLDVFVRSTRERINTIDFDYDCHGNYTLDGREVTDGRPPKQ